MSPMPTPDMFRFADGRVHVQPVPQHDQFQLDSLAFCKWLRSTYRQSCTHLQLGVQAQVAIKR